MDFAVPLTSLLAEVPPYDERRAIIARDGLASVDGFRVICLLVATHLWDVRVCWHCPLCNNDEDGTPCQDLFGSNATADGGILVRVDGFDLPIEAQKSGGCLHGHAQVHAQCLHQHTPLTEVMIVLALDKAQLVGEYLRYKAHVYRQVYADTDAWAQRREATAEAWPEYKDSVEWN